MLVERFVLFAIDCIGYPYQKLAGSVEQFTGLTVFLFLFLAPGSAVFIVRNIWRTAAMRQ